MTQDEGPQPSSRRRVETEPHRAVLMSSIQKRPVDWLWKPYLQRRAINLLTGDPGVGKSTVVCEIVAALSRGRPLPGEPADLVRPPMTCWVMNGEDAADDTIKWRMENQGADPKRVLITDHREVITSKVAEEIGAECRRLGVGLLVIDPLQAWMGKDVDMNKANETRDWGSHLRQVAMEQNLAVLLCRHRRKGQPGDNKLYSGIGSIDITGIARSELAAYRDKQGNCYIERIKGTIGRTGGTLSYIIEDSPQPGNDHGVLRWQEMDALSAGPNGPRAPSNRPKALGLAVEWLIAYLQRGPQPAQAVYKAAQGRGLSERTLQRAKTEAGVVSKQVTDGNWQWELGAIDVTSH